MVGVRCAFGLCAGHHGTADYARPPERTTREAGGQLLSLP